jgi:hypothetical protein
MKIAGQYTPFWGGQYVRFLHFAFTSSVSEPSMADYILARLAGQLYGVCLSRRYRFLALVQF